MAAIPIEIVKQVEDYLVNFWEQWGKKEITKLKEENKEKEIKVK